MPSPAPEALADVAVGEESTPRNSWVDGAGATGASAAEDALQFMAPGDKLAQLLANYEVQASFNCHRLQGLRRTDGVFVVASSGICFVSNFFLNPGGLTLTLTLSLTVTRKMTLPRESGRRSGRKF